MCAKWFWHRNKLQAALTGKQPGSIPKILAIVTTAIRLSTAIICIMTRRSWDFRKGYAENNVPYDELISPGIFLKGPEA